MSALLHRSRRIKCDAVWRFFGGQAPKPPVLVLPTRQRIALELVYNNEAVRPAVEHVRVPNLILSSSSHAMPTAGLTAPFTWLNQQTVTRRVSIFRGI